MLFRSAYLSAFVKTHIKLHDTCGVLNLHGIPGVIGALISAIIAYRTGTNFGSDLSSIYPYQALNRTPEDQAGYQLAGLGICLGIAIGGGLLTGFIASREWFMPPPVDALFDDKHHWANCVIEHEELHELKNQMNSTNNRSDSKVPQGDADDTIRLKASIN